MRSSRRARLPSQKIFLVTLSSVNGNLGAALGGRKKKGHCWPHLNDVIHLKANTGRDAWAYPQIGWWRLYSPVAAARMTLNSIYLLVMRRHCQLGSDGEICRSSLHVLMMAHILPSANLCFSLERLIVGFPVFSCGAAGAISSSNLL